ncbi:hypothetical protein KC678_04040 [Candidatus Dojkabacteria bacterium]|uniref:Uncharacterized protein n=1 Tax=Candidatus Dojkabacteria bacterium TaxID=2099670 RepID=A0A955L1Z5_9BACT|nr:hypothetical protein [Candidatus Dojkabacteria bacterium]
MNRAHPLINPAPRDFSKITSSRREIEEDMEQVQVPKEQLKFPDEP